MTSGAFPGDAAGSRAGFACLVGRPNVGKSTLVNALVGEHVAIVTDKPQTTRRLVRAVVNRPEGQLVVVDTPGLHRPRNLLGERLGELTRAAMAEVDAVVLCSPADAPLGRGDRYLAELVAGVRTPVLAAVTRTDLASREAVAARLLEVTALGDWAEVLPVSAVTGEGVGTLSGLLMARLPPGPPLFPESVVSDSPEDVVIAELIREQALDGVREELPHSIAVTVEELRRDHARIEVDAVLWVERDSQKPIVIGRGGARLKATGTAARARIEALLGTRVHLDLRVKVARDWQRDPKQLRRLGW